jgi:Phage integrase family
VAPPTFGEINHGSPAVYGRYAARTAVAVAGESRQVTASLLDGVRALADDDVVDPSRHPWLNGRPLWLQLIVRGSGIRPGMSRTAHGALRDPHSRAVRRRPRPPAAEARVCPAGPAVYVLTDEEVRRLFTAIDSQPMSSCTNKALVDPVLFRVLCGAGLRISEALRLTLADVDARSGALRIRDSKNGESRTVPVTSRLTATLEGYIAAAHPCPETSDHVFYGVAPGRPISQPTAYLRFRGYLADAGIPHFAGGPHRTRCATASPSPTCAAGPRKARTWP